VANIFLGGVDDTQKTSSFFGDSILHYYSFAFDVPYSFSLCSYGWGVARF
jgi:hypothetical protein